MVSGSSARLSARALFRTAAIGATVGLGLGGAYLATESLAQAAARQRADRLADAAAQRFSDQALRTRGAAMEPGALAIAQRHDPYADPFAAPRDSGGELVTATLDLPARSALRAASPANAPALPFRAATQDGRDLDCLTQAVYYEARGEGAEGEAAVAQVVLNRVRHPAFPKTVCGVVYQGVRQHECQFSFACDGSVSSSRQDSAWRRAQAIAARALNGYVTSVVGDATHFHAARVSTQWSGMIRVAQVGQHVFYRFGGGHSAPDVFHEPAKPVYASLAPLPQAPKFMAFGVPVEIPAAEAAAAKTAPAPAAPSGVDKPGPAAIAAS